MPRLSRCGKCYKWFGVEHYCHSHGWDYCEDNNTYKCHFCGLMIVNRKCDLCGKSICAGHGNFDKNDPQRRGIPPYFIGAGPLGRVEYSLPRK